jgi:ferredoxin-NADP reductase
VDRYVELVAPAFSTSEVRAEVVAVTRQTPATVTLELRPNDLWRGFRAGQFVLLAVEVDGVRHVRSYSPAGSEHAGDGRIELTVKAHPQGVVSRHLVDRARPGMVVGLSQADGDFVLPERRPDDLLLVSGGSGVTPVMSMLRTLRDEGHAGRVTVLHYARTRADVCYAAELERAGATVVHTREPGARRFSAATVPQLATAHAYAGGPTALVDAVRDAAAEAGSESRLRVEHFVPPAPAPAPDAGGTLTFARSGVTAAGDGRPLLEQAEAAGLAPVHGCRMGICHTCTCRKTAGHVLDLRTGEVLGDDEPDIRICVSAPVGDVTLDL